MNRWGYKKHSDSYLMSLKKKDIIAELRAAEHNFFVTDEAFDNAVEAGKKYAMENEALKLLIEWAEECGFGYDNFPEEYERYKDEIEGMGYTEGMIHIAKRVYQQKIRDNARSNARRCERSVNDAET